ncbi:hypothetical protein [Arthrobacter sp. H14]|uniref:hypothetical protein n=1 Tax=Arthrobacter sp. H14 TaxID=1312959 RepID=UPI00047AE151|nr:hypothetical protein [Arthrobacter sp. H14]
MPETEPRARIFGSTADLLLGHRQKVTAGVPGCTCGESFPEATWAVAPALHAQHVSEAVTFHVLNAAFAEIQVDMEHYAATPARQAREGSHDSYSAARAITRMMTREGRRTAVKVAS